MKGVRQADDPFVCFAAKPDKGFGLEISDGIRNRRGNSRESGVGRRNPQEQLATGEAKGQLADDTRQQKRPVGMRYGPEAVREGQSGWVGIPGSFVEISLEIHNCVSLQMHQECSVSQLKLLALELTQAYMFVCSLFFFSHSLDCISCGHREMCDTPIGTTR